ncbi:MAG: S-methyl-5'-thioadenosine phosphorylase [Proteobacteria bacterium]|nr:S-methyl-5'-thioadenosine phosphorylase [Pseudomonadota bacterium]
MEMIGIIGGSGLYNIGLENSREIEIETPFGNPSDKIIVGELKGVKFAFLPRHGRGHRIMPSEINYRANIYALKSLGVKRILSISAVGSMKEEISPGCLVLPDQFIDFTKMRENTFFGDGIVAHVSMAEPVCPSFFEIIRKVILSRGYPLKEGGTYICIEGPQFSTKAESFLWRSMGVDVIGMTNMPEAKLAREAEMCYVTLALATDYDCWHQVEEAVSVESIIKILNENVEKSKDIVRSIPDFLEQINICECENSLKYAIITDPKIIPSEKKTSLKPIIGKYLD